MFGKMRILVCAGLVGMGLLGASAREARACDYTCSTYKFVTSYECVTVYETRCEPYRKVFVLYDDCGRAYQVTKTCYREVEVPVKKVVPVTKKVLVWY